MKKRLFVMAMAGVALAGCVSDEVADVTQKQELVKIAFESPVLYDNAVSRGQVTGEYNSFTYDSPFAGTYSYPRDEKFIVFSRSYVGTFTSWDTGQNYWETAYVTTEYDPSVNGWKITDKDYYWPGGNKKLVFAACSPADLKAQGESETPTATYAADGLTVTGFKVASTPANQFELLYSNRSFNNIANEPGSQNYYNGAVIRFKHALSSIHFALKKDVDVQTPIYLRSLVLENISDKGTFKENIDETDKTAAPAWQDHTGNQEYTIYNANGTVGVAFPGDMAQHIHDLRAENSQDLFSGSLLLLPQSLPVPTSASLKIPENITEPIIKVTYKIGTEADNESNVKTIYVSPGGRSGFDANNDPVAINSWLPGKSYTYILTYTSASHAKDKIYFAPQTSGWEVINNIEIPLQ